MTQWHHHLLLLFDKYVEATGKKQSYIGRLAMNDGHLYDRLRAGRALSVETYDKVVAWFSDHWPPDAVWPESVGRPS